MSARAQSKARYAVDDDVNIGRNVNLGLLPRRHRFSSTGFPGANVGQDTQDSTGGSGVDGTSRWPASSGQFVAAIRGAAQYRRPSVSISGVRPATRSAVKRPEPQDIVQPMWPCPVFRKRFSYFVRPSTGTVVGVIGRSPAQ